MLVTYRNGRGAGVDKLGFAACIILAREDEMKIERLFGLTDCTDKKVMMM